MQSELACNPEKRGKKWAGIRTGLYMVKGTLVQSELPLFGENGQRY